MAIIKTGSTFTDGKNVASEDYVNNKVKTDVPAGAVFTDTNTVTTINGKTGVISKSDITALGIPAQDTTYNVATTSTNGLMSSTDKTKLDGISTGAQKNSDITKAEIEAKLTGDITSHTHDTYLPKSGGQLDSYVEKLVTLSNGTINLNNGNVFYRNATANTTFSITNAKSGAHSFTLFIQMGTTVRTLTFPSSVKWDGGEIPDMTTASKMYILTFVTIDSGSNWYGMEGGKF